MLYIEFRNRDHDNTQIYRLRDDTNGLVVIDGDIYIGSSMFLGNVAWADEFSVYHESKNAFMKLSGSYRETSGSGWNPLEIGIVIYDNEREYFLGRKSNKAKFMDEYV